MQGLRISLRVWSTRVRISKVAADRAGAGGSDAPWTGVAGDFAAPTAAVCGDRSMGCSDSKQSWWAEYAGARARDNKVQWVPNGPGALVCCPASAYPLPVDQCQESLCCEQKCRVKDERTFYEVRTLEASGQMERRESYGVYEPPLVTEVGNFAELTHGFGSSEFDAFDFFSNFFAGW